MIMHKNKTCRPKIKCRAIVNGRQNEYRKKYLSEITRQVPQLRNFAPIVQLNIYKQGMDIYDYNRLNRNSISI